MNVALWVLLAMLGAPDAGPPRCLVAGRPRHLGGLMVSPGDGRPGFALHVDDVPVEVRFGAGGDALVDVKGPLAFSATIARDALPLRSRSWRRLEAGRLVLSPRTPLQVGGAEGAELLVAPAPDRLVHFGPIALACTSLTLGDVAAPRARIVRPAVGVRLVPSGERVELRADADAASAPLVVRLEAGAPFMLNRVARRAGWVQVRASWSDGTSVGGWVEAASVVPFELDYFDALDGIAGGICGYGGHHGYHGPAVLHPGAAVYDEADGAAWARATRAVMVVVIGRSEWVALVAVPGLDDGTGCRLEHAFVRAEDLTYPR